MTIFRNLFTSNSLLNENMAIPTTATFQSFRPHFDALARVAYFKPVLRHLSRTYERVHYLCRLLVWSLGFIYNLQHVIRVVQVRNSTVRIINVLFILLTTLNTFGKQLAFNLRVERIDNIISILNGPGFAPREPFHKAVVDRNARNQRILLRFFIAAVFMCGALWGTFPVVNRLLGKEVELTAYFPFVSTVTPGFEIAVTYLTISVTFQAYGNVTMDCTIVSFFAQAKVQLQILRYNLEHLTVFDIEESERTCNEFTGRCVHRFKMSRYTKENCQMLQERFVRCILHYRKIKWFVKEIESIFAEALALQFLVMVWVVCMTVYKLANLNMLFAEMVSLAVYLICMLAQLFIYCYYGTQLQHESELVNQSVYFSGWTQLPPTFRRQLLILMESGSRPIIPLTASIIPISLTTYIMVLRASYTLFTFLSNN